MPTPRVSWSSCDNTLAFESRPSHNAAFSRWAEDLPVPVLADVLGIDPNTAAQWCTLVQRNWADYVAERANASNHPRPAAEE
jgi:hypothetical protein